MPRKTQRNSITSDDKTAQINPSNMRLKDDFLAYLSSVQRSPGTIRGYDNDLLIVFTYILECLDNKNFERLTKRDIASIQNWLIHSNGNSPARVRRIKAAMSSLSNYIETILDDEEEFKDFRPIVRKIENPAMQAVRPKTVWSDEELDELLEKLSAAGEHKKACAVALAMCSGRRKAELGRFRVSDFDEKNLVCAGALYKTSEPLRTKGFGMGKYIYCYTMAKKFRPYLDAWLQQRKELGIDSEWLLPDAADQSEQIGQSTLNSWALTFSRLSGRDFYWHSLRHYMTTNLAKLGLPDNVIQSIIGWTSADMVGVYKDIDAEDEMAQYFDENGDIKSGGVKSLTEL